jgi:NAD(P)-dependent dehydrogenase (short-subunit alcohol dehydrogenase family)
MAEDYIPPKGNRLEGKVAVVTGSGRGIGRAHAIALAAQGARVVVNDPGVERDGAGGTAAPADEVVAFIKENGGEATANYNSVADFTQAAQIIQTAIDTYGQLDILVNNAGISRDGLFHQIGPEDFAAVVGTHLKGTFNTCRHAVPLMMQQRSGRIINTASSQWRNPEGRAAYGAAKGGIVSLTWDLAFELRYHNITVNAIAPMAQTRGFIGYRHPEMLEDAGLTAKKAGDELAANRPGAEHVSPIVVWLATEAASKVTGCVFRAGSRKFGIYSHPTEVRSINKDWRKRGKWTPDELDKVLSSSLLFDGTTAPFIPD